MSTCKVDTDCDANQTCTNGTCTFTLTSKLPWGTISIVSIGIIFIMIMYKIVIDKLKSLSGGVTVSNDANTIGLIAIGLVILVSLVGFVFYKLILYKANLIQKPSAVKEKYISYENIPFEPRNIRYYSQFNR